MTKLSEVVNSSQDDFDTYDTVYDVIITVCYDPYDKDYYDKFCNGIINYINVVRFGKDTLTCDWADFIERNIDVFKDFTANYWGEQYEDDDDEFVYQWLNEIEGFLAGNTSESVYRDFVINYMPRLK